MDHLFDLKLAETWLTAAVVWLKANALVVGNLAQLVGIGVGFVIARLAAPHLRKAVVRLRQEPWVQRYLSAFCQTLEDLALPIVWLALQWLGVLVAGHAGWPNQLGNGVVSLLTAWVVIRLASTLVGDLFWSRVVTLSAWTVAALNIVGLLGPTRKFLDDLALTVGDTRLSVLGVIKGIAALAFLLWLARLLSGVLDRRIHGVANISPSMQVLFAKLGRIALFTLAVLMAMNAIGIDLTAFAVFSGALGLGIGFGLQKVFANLISGIILLLDKSVKPGDVIAIGQTFGWIRTLGARYVSVITRDGTEHLIPNEELISQRVENWSFSDRLVRQKIPFGISYASDPRQAMRLAEAAARKVPRVLADPAPVCRMMGLGDSSVDFELRVWIDDPEKGVANVRSEVLLNLWDAFHEGGVEFPFPQRDLHIRSAVPVTVVGGTEAT